MGYWVSKVLLSSEGQCIAGDNLCSSTTLHMCSLKAHRRLGLYYTPPRGLLKSQATLINLYHFEWEIIHQMDHFSNSVKGNTVELNTISVELCGFLQFSCVTRI